MEITHSLAYSYSSTFSPWGRTIFAESPAEVPLEDPLYRLLKRVSFSLLNINHPSIPETTQIAGLHAKGHNQ